MLERTITCDYCGKTIKYKEEEYITVDDLHLHESCWQTLIKYINEQILK